MIQIWSKSDPFYDFSKCSVRIQLQSTGTTVVVQRRSVHEQQQLGQQQQHLPSVPTPTAPAPIAAATTAAATTKIVDHKWHQSAAATTNATSSTKRCCRSVHMPVAAGASSTTVMLCFSNHQFSIQFDFSSSFSSSTFFFFFLTFSCSFKVDLIFIMCSIQFFSLFLCKLVGWFVRLFVRSKSRYNYIYCNFIETTHTQMSC